MKPFLICLFLIPLLSSAQQKKDSKITISAKDTVDVFNNAVKTFYQQGYIVDQKDEANGFFATKERSLKNDASTSVIFKVLVSGNEITITGEAVSNVTLSFGGVKAEKTFTPIYFGGMKGSSLRNAWDEMDKMAEC